MKDALKSCMASLQQRLTPKFLSLTSLLLKSYQPRQSQGSRSQRKRRTHSQTSKINQVLPSLLTHLRLWANLPSLMEESSKRHKFSATMPSGLLIRCSSPRSSKLLIKLFSRWTLSSGRSACSKQEFPIMSQTCKE